MIADDVARARVQRHALEYLVLAEAPVHIVYGELVENRCSHAYPSQCWRPAAAGFKKDSPRASSLRKIQTSVNATAA
jgi:hypothetical protein